MALIEVPYLDKWESDLPDLINTSSICFIGHPSRSHAGNFYVINMIVGGSQVDAKFATKEEAVAWYNTIKSQVG